MAKRITSKNLPPVTDNGIENVIYDLIQDLKIMGRDSFFKNQLFDEYHPDFLEDYCTCTTQAEYVIQYINNRLHDYWKILNPEQ
jgi:hypothetical protein